MISGRLEGLKRFGDLGGFFDCIGRVLCLYWKGLLVLDLIGRVCFVEKLNFQAVIKSAASAASPKTKIQESRGA